MESGLLALKLNRRAATDLNYELKQKILRLKIFFPRIYAERLKERSIFMVCSSSLFRRLSSASLSTSSLMGM